MTGRQRLLATIAGDQVDRIPVAPFIHVNFVQAFFGGAEIDVVTRTGEVYDHFFLDTIHRNCTPGHDEIGPSTQDWQVERQTEYSGRNSRTVTTVRTPDGDLCEISQTNWVTAYDAESSPVDYLIKSENDLDILMAHQPVTEPFDTTAIPRALEAIGDRGIVAPWMQGVFNHAAYYSRRVDDLIVDALISPEFYHRMMEYFLKRNCAIASRMVDAGVDMLSYGGNIASGKMVGEQFFRDHVLPYEARLIRFIQDKGVPVLYHNCGYARNLFPAYRQLGMRVYESLTAPPYGDTIVEEAFEQLGSQMVMMGGVDQIKFLRKASPGDIRLAVKGFLKRVKGRGRFILGTSDYFLEDTPHPNIMALASAALEHGEI
jgi:uroporphyrinogen decarboxylase